MPTNTTTDMKILYKSKEYPVPAGFTVEEYKESLISVFPEAANADLIKDKEGVYTLKPRYGEKA